MTKVVDKCPRCGSANHGETIWSDEFGDYACFKCMIFCLSGGDHLAAKIRRETMDGLWYREFTRDGKNGWVPMFETDGSIEEAYQRYLAKLIVT